MNENLLSFDPSRWVERYADALYAYALSRVDDVQQAEDIVQNTFLSAWNARHTYKGQASEKNWLYAVLKNKIIDHFRKQRAQTISLDDNEANSFFDDADHWTDAAGPKDWDAVTNTNLETREFYTILEQCKRKLKDIQQTVFAMRYMEDVDSEEICKVLNITPSNYWVLIHRAKLNLRKCLEKNWMGIK